MSYIFLRVHSTSKWIQYHHMSDYLHMSNILSNGTLNNRQTIKSYREVNLLQISSHKVVCYGAIWRCWPIGMNFLIFDLLPAARRRSVIWHKSFKCPCVSAELFCRLEKKLMYRLWDLFKVINILISIIMYLSFK